jgi:hypothetical protein
MHREMGLLLFVFWVLLVIRVLDVFHFNFVFMRISWYSKLTLWRTIVVWPPLFRFLLLSFIFSQDITKIYPKLVRAFIVGLRTQGFLRVSCFLLSKRLIYPSSKEFQVGHHAKNVVNVRYAAFALNSPNLERIPSLEFLHIFIEIASL